MPPEQSMKIKKIINLLKLDFFTLVIGKTSQGEIGIKVTKEGDVSFTLDSVPVNKDTEKELTKIMF